jgi:hypothetical protein
MYMYNINSNVEERILFSISEKTEEFEAALYYMYSQSLGSVTV